MPDCKACGKWFATMEQCELCPTCERALERLRNYAAPVVHCKDCKKLGTGECPMEQDYPWISTDSDDFCSYGERRASDGE